MYEHINQLNDENKVYYKVGAKHIILGTVQQLYKEWIAAKEGYVMETTKHPGKEGNHRPVILGKGRDIGMIISMYCMDGSVIKLPEKSVGYE